MSISIAKISKALGFAAQNAKTKIFAAIAYYLGAPTTTKHVVIQPARLIKNFSTAALRTKSSI